MPTLPDPQVNGVVITDSLWNEIVNLLNHIAQFTLDGDQLNDLPVATPLGGWTAGDLKWSYRRTNIGDTWLICDGRWVGNSLSNADYAADKFASLFQVLWTYTDISVFELQDSSGNPVSWGASWSVDWNQNYRVRMPDFRGRGLVMLNNVGSGTPPTGSITASWAASMGGRGGAETHTLTLNEMAAHDHAIADGIPLGDPLSSASASGGTYLNTRAASATTQKRLRTSSQGSGAAHNNLPPSAAAGAVMIYTGVR